ncbi:MAG: signal peptidase I [Pseudomonadota bacterium]
MSRLGARIWMGLAWILVPLMIAAGGYILTPGLVRVMGGGYHHIPGGSMKPTLFRGDSVLSTPPGQVRRGAIVIARFNTLRPPVIARVVGLGGDRIAIKGGLVWLNGQPAQMEPRPDFVEIYNPARAGARYMPRCSAPQPLPGGVCRKERWRETFADGTSHHVLNISGKIGDEANMRYLESMSQMLIPQGHLFLMGDNRDNSHDSRRYGPLPLEAVEGRVMMIQGSWQGLSPRLERFWKMVE